MFHSTKGQTVIEGVVALAAIMVILAAVAIAISTSIANSQFIRMQSLAAKYTQQGMEKIRYLRNNDPSAFKSVAELSQTYCLNNDNVFTDNNGTPNSSAGAACTRVEDFFGDSFIREVKFAWDSAVDCSSGTRVTVSVFYSSGRCPTSKRYCHESRAISCLSDESESGRTL